MIPGILGALLLEGAAPGGGGGGSLPPGAVAHLDFLNGFYYAGGSQQAVTALLGGGFSDAYIVARGLLCDAYPSVDKPRASGDFLTDLQTQFASGACIVMEIDYDAFGSGALIYATDSVASPTEAAGVLFSNADRYLILEQWGPGATPDSVQTPVNAMGASGVHRIAMNFYRDEGTPGHYCGLSINGGAAVSTHFAEAGDWLSRNAFPILNFDGYTGDLDFDTYLREITLYPSVDPADLPAMSELST